MALRVQQALRERIHKKHGDMKPKDRMGCLDVDVLKKHGCNDERVKNDTMFLWDGWMLMFSRNMDVMTSVSR